MWSIGVTLKPEGSKMCRKNERSVSYNVWITGTGVGVGVSLWLKVCGVPPKWVMWNPIMTSSPMHVRLWGGISRVDMNVFTSCEVLQCWLRGLVWCNTHTHAHAYSAYISSSNLWARQEGRRKTCKMAGSHMRPQGDPQEAIAAIIDQTRFSEFDCVCMSASYTRRSLLISLCY